MECIRYLTTATIFRKMVMSSLKSLGYFSVWEA